MPSLRQQQQQTEPIVAVDRLGRGLGPRRTPWPSAPATDRGVRDELRRQIARMERELGELFSSAFPRRGIEWTVGAAGGPRVLGVAELELIRDRLAHRIADARAEIARRADAEEASRALVERMIADPDEYKWVRVSNEDVGEPGCKHWHSRPRWGIVGLFLGWWRVKLSSGCPLAAGPAAGEARTNCRQEPEQRAWPRSRASDVASAGSVPRRASCQGRRRARSGRSADRVAPIGPRSRRRRPGGRSR